MKRKLFIITVILLSALFSPAALTAYAEDGGVLLVCRTDNEAETLSDLISACGKTAEIILEKDYKEHDVNGFKYLVTISTIPIKDAQKAGIKPFCAGNGFSSTADVTLEAADKIGVSVSYKSFSQPFRQTKAASLISGYSGEAFGAVNMSLDRKAPFGVITGNAVYAPYYTDGDLSLLMLGDLLQRYFGSFGGGNIYVLIDEIYAASDLGLLCEAADALYEHGIPFIARIMPVYDNLDYPAFLRYTQVLRYIQSKGASVVIHEPLERTGEIAIEPLDKKLLRFHKALDGEGVQWSELEYSPYRMEIGQMESFSSTGGIIEPFEFDIMINLPLTVKSGLDTDIGRLRSLRPDISDYGSKFPGMTPVYDEAPLSAEYEYITEARPNMFDFFDVSGKVLTLIVGVSLALLIVFLFIGRRLYHKKFY